MALNFPDSPSDGQFYEGFVYSSANSTWRVTKDPAIGNAIASGGNETVTGTNYKYHVFTSSDTLTVSAAGNAEVLIVAGGGGGGSGSSSGYENSGGGGGAGGLLYSEVFLEAKAYDVIVGAGGPSVSTYGANGNDSQIEQFLARAGGPAGRHTHNQITNPGGSGGGAGASVDGGAAGGTGRVGQGHDGGNAANGDGGAGGGGAGGEGMYGQTNSPSGAGGAGRDFSSWTTEIATAGGATYGETGYFAGGGGGGHRRNRGQLGGIGGGGNGSFGVNAGAVNREAGSANTGGGGGGGASQAGGNTTGGPGGSGIVIVRYPV